MKPKTDRRRKPLRARCPYCETTVTGAHISRTVYGWGCKDEKRCEAKDAAARKAKR